MCLPLLFPLTTPCVCVDACVWLPRRRRPVQGSGGLCHQDHPGGGGRRHVPVRPVWSAHGRSRRIVRRTARRAAPSPPPALRCWPAATRPWCLTANPTHPPSSAAGAGSLASCGSASAAPSSSRCSRPPSASTRPSPRNHPSPAARARARRARRRPGPRPEGAAACLTLTERNHEALERPRKPAILCVRLPAFPDLAPPVPPPVCSHPCHYVTWPLGPERKSGRPVQLNSQPKGRRRGVRAARRVLSWRVAHIVGPWTCLFRFSLPHFTAMQAISINCVPRVAGAPCSRAALARAALARRLPGCRAARHAPWPSKTAATRSMGAPPLWTPPQTRCTPPR